MLRSTSIAATLIVFAALATPRTAAAAPLNLVRPQLGAHLGATPPLSLLGETLANVNGPGETWYGWKLLLNDVAITVLGLVVTASTVGGRGQQGVGTTIAEVGWILGGVLSGPSWHWGYSRPASVILGSLGLRLIPATLVVISLLGASDNLWLAGLVLAPIACAIDWFALSWKPANEGAATSLSPAIGISRHAGTVGLSLRY